MTTHLRARASQAGALLAVVVGGIAVAPGVALATPPEVQILNLQTDVVSGGTLTMQYQVADGNDGGVGGGDQRATATIAITGMTCNAGCGQITQVNRQGRQFTAQFTAPTVNAGDQRRVDIKVTATINDETNSDTETVTVKGPDKPQSVRQVTGKVKDQDGKAIAGAAVGMRDSAGGQFQAVTNGSGGYSFTATDTQQIAVGTIQVGAGKDGYQPAQVQVQAQAGRTVNVPLTLKLKVTPTSATPSASASATASAKATTADATPTAENTAGDATTKNAASNQDSGGISWLYIVIGILLVAAGAGAIVLVFLRRKNNDDGDDGDDDDPTSLGGPPGGVPPSQGRFNDATRVAAPVGASNATMVAPRSGAPSLSDAPTMVHHPVPVEDEFPDPYGVPIPQQGGYVGAAAGAWDSQAYGEPAPFDPQADDAYGYGAPVDNYGAAPQQRFDEPTGLYQPEVDDAGYGDYDSAGYSNGNEPHYDGGTYGAAPPAAGATYAAGQQYGAGGYAEPEPADQRGYGAWGAPAGGLDSGGNAYGPQPGGTYGASAAPPGGATYGGGQQYGGYDQAGYADQGGHDQRGAQQYGPGFEQAGFEQAGFDQAGFDQAGFDQAGYDQAGHGDRPGYEQGGYDQHGGTYGEQPSRHGGQPRQEPSHQGQRRSRDWDS